MPGFATHTTNRHVQRGSDGWIVAGSGLGAVSAGDAAGPAGLTHAVGEPKRQRQPIGYCNAVSIAYRYADRFAHPDGIAIGVPDLVSDADSRADASAVSELADRRIPPRRDGCRERERQNCAAA
jgi:hypothetical protein